MSAKVLRRRDFRFFHDIATRWSDNDMYGHINNSVYHHFADTMINKWLIEHGGMDPMKSRAIGLCLTNSFHYYRPLAYPTTITAGLLVRELRTSSVTYQVGIFGGGHHHHGPRGHPGVPSTNDDEETAAAVGSFVHVFVDSSARTKVAIPPELKQRMTDKLL